MDLMYSRYSNPMELIKLYINQGRFGEFVTEVVSMEYKRTKQKMEQSEDWKLWIAYVFGIHEETFQDWKAGIMQNAKQGKTKTRDTELTDEDISDIMNELFPLK